MQRGHVNVAVIVQFDDVLVLLHRHHVIQDVLDAVVRLAVIQVLPATRQKRYQRYASWATLSAVCIRHCSI